MIKKLNEEDIVVDWTGSYPTKCFGNWIITIKGLNLSGLGKDGFNTCNEYPTWHFEEWSVVWEYYKDGLNKTKWIDFIINENHNNLYSSLLKSNIEPNEQVLGMLYDAIQIKDWRNNSCGGCI